MYQLFVYLDQVLDIRDFLKLFKMISSFLLVTVANIEVVKTNNSFLIFFQYTYWHNNLFNDNCKT